MSATGAGHALKEALTAALSAYGRGALDEASSWLEAASRGGREHPDVLHLRGLVALARHEVAIAVGWMERAVRTAPRVASYWNNLGVARRQAGSLDLAAQAHARAIALAPSYASAHNNLGAVLAEREDYERAAACFARAIQLGAGDPDTHANLILAHARCEEGAAALAAVEVAHGAGLTGARLDIAHGAALLAVGRHAEAVTSLADSAKRWPAESEAWHNLGFALARQGSFAPARDAFDRALALAPGVAATHLSRGLVRLSLGDYRGGWSDCRMRRGGPVQRGIGRLVLDEGLSGQRIRITRDQGVGDDLFFLRFAPLLSARGADVSVDVDPRLHTMLARAGFPVGGPCDAAIMSGDLPFRLGHEDDEDCPAALQLDALPERISTQRAMLAAAGPRPWIAVSWRAGVKGQMKRVPAEQLARLLRNLPGTIVCIQRDPQPGELAAFSAALGRALFDATAINADLESMLALMHVVDEHVAVSNTNLHLRAAAGRATRVLVPFPAEWRWRESRDGALPWFRDHRAYRQGADFCWELALAQLAVDLLPATQAP